MSMIHICGDNSTSTMSQMDKAMIQQAAVDVRLKTISKIGNSLFVIDEDSKTLRDTTLLEPDSEGFWNLEPGVYEFTTDHIVQMGKDEAGLVIIRSTFNRAGCLISSGVYDPAYHGSMAGALHITCGPAKIKKGVRIGQFVMWKVDGVQGEYSGDYGFNKDGSIKEMEKRYHA